MGYSSDELEASVSNLVRGTLSFPTDRLGPTDSDTVFQETSELINSVFLYDTDTIFYIIYLASNYIRQSVLAELSTCASFLSTVDDLAVINRSVDDISGLAEASRALTAMEGSIARQGSISSTEYSRYTNALNSINSQLGQVTRRSYTPRGSSQVTRDIVYPNAEARSLVQSLFSTLTEQHSTTISRVSQLSQSLTEYLSENLATRVGQQQLTQASSQLSGLYESLNAIQPDDRTAVARDSLLTTLSNKTVIKALAEQLSPTDPRIKQPASSSPTYRISAYGTGSPASITGSISSPWPLDAPKNLGFNLNGSSVTVNLFPSGEDIQPAQVEGVNIGPFSISGDLALPHYLLSAAQPYDTLNNGNLFHIEVNGSTYYCTLTQGAAQTAVQVSIDLNNPANWTPSMPGINPSAIAGQVKISYNTVGAPAVFSDRYMKILQDVKYAQDLWFWTVDPGTGPIQISESYGWSANDKLWIKANDDPSYQEITFSHGSWPDYHISSSTVVSEITAQAGSELFHGSDVNFRVSVVSDLSGEGSIITILHAGLGTPSYLGMQTIGFIDGQEDRQQDVYPQHILNVLNHDTSFNAEAAASINRTEYLTSDYAIKGTGANEVDIPAPTDPTSSWPSLSELKLHIETGDNRGVYDIDTATWAASTLTLALIFPPATSRRLRDTSAVEHKITVYSEKLVITSTDQSPSSSAQATDPANSARTIVGLDSSTHLGTVSKVLVEQNSPSLGWIPYDLSPHHIKINDKITDHTLTILTSITAISEQASGILSVSPEVQDDFSLSTTGFSIESAAYLAYIDFETALQDWIINTIPPYESDLSDIDDLLSPLLHSTPTKDRVDNVYLAVESLQTKLESISTILNDYVITKIKEADQFMSLLLERGYTRLRSLFLKGEISNYYTSTEQTASFARAVQDAAKQVVINDANTTSLAQSRFDADFVRYAGDWQENTDPLYDYSDMEPDVQDADVEEYFRGFDESVG